MNAVEEEYHRFGPWVLEISDKNPVPNYFQDYSMDGDSLFSIKVPRPIDRLKAKPGMELYDYMLNLYEDRILILHREKAGITNWVIPYSHIIGISHSQDLLSGKMDLYTEEKTFSLPFSTVSSDLIDIVIEMILQRIPLPDDKKVGSFQNRNKNRPFSFMFQKILEGEINKFPSLHILAHQPESVLFEKQDHKWNKLKHRIVKTTLLESMHLFNGRELRIWNRIIPVNRWKRSVLGKKCLMIPLKRLQNLEWHNGFNQLQMKTLVFKYGSFQESFPFLVDNRDIPDYKNYLLNL